MWEIILWMLKKDPKERPTAEEVVKEVHDKTRVLVCACPSTAKVFVMNVPREIESCESAQNWLHGNRSVRVIGAS